MQPFVPATHHARSLPGLTIWLTLHVADKSAVAAINRALRGCRVRSLYPCYFGTVHYRPLLIRQKASLHGILRKVLQCYPLDVSYFIHGN